MAKESGTEVVPIPAEPWIVTDPNDLSMDLNLIPWSAINSCAMENPEVSFVPLDGRVEGAARYWHDCYETRFEYQLGVDIMQSPEAAAKTFGGIAGDAPPYGGTAMKDVDLRVMPGGGAVALSGSMIMRLRKSPGGLQQDELDRVLGLLVNGAR